MHVQIALYDGFDPLDVLGPFEVFHSAGLFSGGQVTTEFVAAEGAREVPSGFASITLTATAALDPRKKSVIVVPGAAGGLSMDPAIEGGIGRLLAAAGRSELPNRLREALAGPDAAVATVCGGSILLAHAGLADGRPLVTHERGRDLTGTKAVPVEARMVDDGNLLSSGNVTSGIDLALHLVEREVGPRVAHAVGELIRHERRGTVWSTTGAPVVAA
ncbi:ThiJ/PfpI family protein [Amycolatopsis mediterranei S699]|uniref:ThiJ/PfpI family protein n=2 Tax=Amycolatopsis mediterranei TaxID=33910 RepID=A0A0H3DB85_AMYMU|nr:DJ-1/PfpI family protein [Amycolatopsis mediterranei]ADJ48245.1 ThiJ/PfpI family protein [Amycolatopsis mediterranei U32]AEK45156.1 ThiJ/PfpI family protein [Amycolatopsis mediterranei S699]AFO79956.1 ThiJ/PfpI family protein [Amycolatopsis mediterranei S699]AGT87084.1 ThiJ/PfpI family protein [Amycolatopsis mediterranei RB]KDO10732.1 glutamine amidotransferase [Amycolatopsis mediterranei]